MSTQYFNLNVIIPAAFLAMTGSAYANAAETISTETISTNHELSQPIQLVQSFVETMDYQLLSNADKAVWDEQTWNEIQANAAQSNQVRLAEGHPFYELERAVREQVTIEANDAERAPDGSIRVTTEMAYPYVLMLIDDFIETKSSFAYEQLLELSQALTNQTLDVAQLDVHRSSMPWRVQDGGVFVDAAQMQENREALQAQGW